MSRILRSTQRTRSWPSWAGEINDLKRLARLVEELYELRLKQFVEQGRQSAVSGGQTPAGADAPQHESYEIPEYPFLGATILDEDKVTGAFEDVFPEIDRRSLRSIAFVGAISPRERIVVRLGRAEEAAVVEIISSDTGWARQAFAGLTQEIEKGVPRWSFMCGMGMGHYLGLWLASTIVGLAVFLASPTDVLINEPDAFMDFLLATLVTVVMGQILNQSIWLQHFIFPHFEILGEGAQSSGSRRIVATSLLAISVPIGIFVNQIS